MKLRSVFAKNLLAYRRARGLSQEDLADAAEIDRTYVSALERCQYAASIDVIERLSIALQIQASDLLQTASPSK